MAIMTTTTAANHIGEKWAPKVQGAMEFETIISARASRTFEKYRGGMGDIVHVPRGTNLAAQTKSSGSAWTPEANTDTEQTLTVNTQKVAGFEIEDLIEVLTSVDTRNYYTKKIGYALARATDVSLASLAASFSTVYGTLGSELTADHLRSAAASYTTAGWKMNQDTTWVLSTGAYFGLMSQDQFVNAQYNGNQDPLITGNFGRYLGAPIVVSNLTTAPSAGQSESFLMNKEGIQLVMAQPVKMISDYIATDIASVVGGHIIYGFAENNYTIETASSTSITDAWLVLLRTLQ